jgi:glycosyltransferase involved in cell wall biosynthesis
MSLKNYTPQTISVCIATYNGSKYIREQLNSILTQLPEHSEVIVSDDNSTDTTVEIIKGMRDKRIHIFVNSKREGVIQNFENALTKASNSVIFLADQDDIWLADKVALTLPLLEKYSLVNHDCILIDEQRKTLVPSLFSINNAKAGIVKNIYLNSYTGCCMAFNRSLLTQAIPIPKNTYIQHDVWLGIIAEIYGEVYFLNQPLIEFRRHDETETQTGKTSKNTLSRKIKMRIFLIYFILKKLVQKKSH